MHKNPITLFNLKTIHTNTNITDTVVTPRTVITIGQIIAVGIDHKTLNIVCTIDHTIALTIDDTIIHKNRSRNRTTTQIQH